MRFRAHPCQGLEGEITDLGNFLNAMGADISGIGNDPCSCMGHSNKILQVNVFSR